MVALAWKLSNFKLFFLVICSLFLIACTNREYPQILTLKSQVFKAQIQGPFPESGGRSTSFAWNIDYPPNFNVNLTPDHIQILGESTQGCQIDSISGSFNHRTVSIRGCEATNSSISIQISPGSANNAEDFAPAIRGFKAAKLNGELKIHFSSSIPSLNNASTIPLRIFASNPLSQYDARALVLENATVKNSKEISKSEWEFEIEPITDGLVRAYLPLHRLSDIYGNQNDHAEIQFTSDRSPPIISIQRISLEKLVPGQKAHWNIQINDLSGVYWDLQYLKLMGATADCLLEIQSNTSSKDIYVTQCSSMGDIWLELESGFAKDDFGHTADFTKSHPISYAPMSDSFFADKVFITKWDTSLTQAGDNILNELTLPLDLNLLYDFHIDWGDGSVERISNPTAPVRHTYGSAAIYTVKMIGHIPRLSFESEISDRSKLLSVEQWGINRWQSMAYMFYYANNFQLHAVDLPNLSDVKDMTSMFEGAIKFNSYIGHWNTSNVTKMGSIFMYAQEFNEYIGGWDVSKVTDMSRMFMSARKFNQAINHWNTSQVTSMADMFSQATLFNQDIGSWDTSQVRDMSNMFFEAVNFNSDIGEWNTSQVQSFAGMFQGASRFNQYIGEWKTHAALDMSGMFLGASAFNSYIGKWNTENVKNMKAMFRDAIAFNDEFIGAWNVSQVEDMSSMFEGAILFNQNLNAWDVGRVKDMSFMFARTSNFNQYIGSWNVSQVLFMDSMFQYSKKFNQDLSAWTINPSVTSANFAIGASSWTAPRPIFP